MKITIIGANSYIARNLIHLFDRDYSDAELFLYDVQEQHLDGYNQFECVDLLNKDECKKINFDCDVIYVFAGKTGTLNGFKEYESFIKINELVLLNILDTYLEKKSSAKIIFPSTRLVYKGANKLLTEEDEKEFKTVYSMSKYSCEQYLNMYNKIYNIPYAIFRICVPYGTMVEGATSYGTNDFMLGKAKNNEDIPLYGDGTIRRTLTNVEDLSNALIVGAVSKSCINDVYNIGGEDYSLKEMAQMIAEKYRVGITYKKWPDDALKIESGSTVFNSNKFDIITNFKYNCKFQDWVKEK